VIVHTVMSGSFAPANVQYRVNYQSTQYLLELARKHSTVRAFVFTSSAEAVGLASGFNTKPETEDEAILCTMKTATNPYARTKGAADALALAFNSRDKSQDKSYEGQLLTTVLRLPGIYGPRDKMISERFYKMANTTDTRFQLGSNKALQSWIYVDSAARAHVLAAKALLDGWRQDEDMAVDGEAFFVTDDDPLHFWDFARRFWVAAGDKDVAKPSFTVIIIPLWVLWLAMTISGWAHKIFTFGLKEPAFTYRHFDYMRKGCWYSSEKAKKRLGFRPVCDTDEGILRTVQWYQKHGKGET